MSIMYEQREVSKRKKAWEGKYRESEGNTMYGSGKQDLQGKQEEKL